MPANYVIINLFIGADIALTKGL